MDRIVCTADGDSDEDLNRQLEWPAPDWQL